jgi:hypothetical protein
MTYGDKIVTISMVIASLISLLLINAFLYNDVGKGVIIEVDGKLYAKYSFDEQKYPKFTEIRTQYGYNKIEIQNGRVRVVEANCPDQIDVKSGWISKENQMLVCLPNRVMIKIIGEGLQLDGITY